MMTMNDFYRTVLAETSNDDVKAICEKYVAKADEKASSKAEMVNTILETLTDTPQTLAEIAEKCGYSWRSVSSILSRELKAGAKLAQGTNEDGRRTYRTYARA